MTAPHTNTLGDAELSNPTTKEVQTMHYAAQRNIARERIVDQQVSKLSRRPAAFGILATIDGHDVIDNASGRAVAHRDTAQSANGIAQSLNAAAQKGTRALAVALGSY